MQELPAFYIGEHAALDFLNSVCAPSGSTIDWLEDGNGLIHWMVGAGLISAFIGEQAEKRFSKKDLNAAAGDARDLRDGFRKVTDKLEKFGPADVSKADLERLNTWLAYPVGAPSVLTNQEGLLERSEDVEISSPHQLVRILADCLADYLTNTNHTQLRQCEGPNCTLYFRDTTKNRSRRWCSMAVCGNRAKAARFRKLRSRSDQS